MIDLAAPYFHGHLESPTAGARVGGLLEVVGWMVGRPPVETELELSVDGRPVKGLLRRTTRPDVAAAFPSFTQDNPKPGFSVTGINLSNYSPGRHRLTVAARCGRQTMTLAEIEVEVLPVAPFYKTAYTVPDKARQRQKLDLLLKVLTCPDCLAVLELVAGTRLRCLSCGSHFPVVDEVPVMIKGEAEYPIDEELLNSPASNNPYPELVTAQLQAVIERGGLALEVGSGRRDFGADRLIQLEICKYPFT